MFKFFDWKRYLLLFSAAPLSALLAQEANTGAATPPLSYEIALQRAIQNDPTLRGVDTWTEVADGEVTQAGLRPNPVLGAEVENIFGSGPFQDLQSAEVSLGISQLIETAGKRAKRTALARSERQLVQWERETRRVELETEVRLAFVDVLISQETLDLRRKQFSLAERSEAEILRQVEAARARQVDMTRAGLAVRQQRFAIDQAERGLNAARQKLAALLGVSDESEFSVTGSITLEPEPPTFTQLLALMTQSATFRQFEGHRQNREASLALEQARAKPDFEVFGGARYFNDTSGDAAIMVGIEIPFPLFDKNQGNIQSARARVSAVAYEQEAAGRRLGLALTDAYQALIAAKAEAESIQEDLVPMAEQTLAETEAGYERGHFSLIAVLESRGTLFEIRESYLDALSRYASAQARIQALTRPTSL
ncbi:MAG: TolC family protein [Kiritimatiellae bacterium]|jgi:cobalt-zinc-cadmium efflux system outer membrane protein|nr:TolC family protein [Kiritimatiellia bacterium]